MPVKFLALLPGSFGNSVNIDTSLVKYYSRKFLLLFILFYFIYLFIFLIHFI